MCESGFNPVLLYECEHTRIYYCENDLTNNPHTIASIYARGVTLFCAAKTIGVLAWVCSSTCFKLLDLLAQVHESLLGFF